MQRPPNPAVEPFVDDVRRREAVAREAVVMSRTRRALGVLCAAACVMTSGQTAFAQAAPDGGNDPYEWDHFFPIFGNEVAARGISMPLPWGIGLNYAYIDQPINIDSLEIAVNDSEFVDLSDVIVFDKLNSQVHGLNTRLDLWLFPFLNVYALGNWIVQSNTEVSLSEPIALDAGALQGGGGGGFGTTAAFGFFGFFGIVDINFTWNKLEKLNAPVRTFLLTPRIGKNFGRVGPVRVVAWVGAMRQNIESETRGSISLREAIGGGGDEVAGALSQWYDSLPPVRQELYGGVVGRINQLQERDPVIHYRLDKSLASPWNMTVGTEIGFNDRFQVRAEVGFINRTQVIVGVNYRFGVFSPSGDE